MAHLLSCESALNSVSEMCLLIIEIGHDFLKEKSSVCYVINVNRNFHIV